MLKRLQNGIARTRAKLAGRLSELLGARQYLDPDTLEQLEGILLSADVGAAVTGDLVEYLQSQTSAPDGWQALLQQRMRGILVPAQVPFRAATAGTGPYAVLVVGVNGVGKTTTIGKLAAILQSQGLKVVLAAGDTFRAAAIAQLEQWGERLGIPVVAQQPGADSAAVIFDALAMATARGADVLLADTAGRLHTKDNLMSELQKIKRVLAKQDTRAPHETIMVIDATAGQNVIAQVKSFQESIGLSSLIITKLDGTAKGGIVFALAEKFGLPIRYIGVGEKIQDLQAFNADEFTEALFTTTAGADLN